MAKVADTVKQSVKELQDSVKQIKDSDEDDLGTLATMFDDHSELADSIAQRLHDADSILRDEDEEPAESGDDEMKNDKEDTENS